MQPPSRLPTQHLDGCLKVVATLQIYKDLMADDDLKWASGDQQDQPSIALGEEMECRAWSELWKVVSLSWPKVPH